MADAGTLVARPAHAKVNLWLNVVGRRGDGYHLLESLVAFVDLADDLTAAPAHALSLVVDGPTAGGLDGRSDNLVLETARALAARAGIAPRAALRLTKRIPVAAGLGGGSADAAAALRALVDLWRVAQPEDELFDLAQSLGADVPMCLLGRPAFASGIGERLMPVPALPPAAILLVNPGAALATRDVFAARRGAFSPPRPQPGAWPRLADLAAELDRRGNDLTEAAIALCPAVAEVLAALRASRGVRFAGMSGSGATCFALCASATEAQAAATALPPAWWRHAGRFVGPPNSA